MSALWHRFCGDLEFVEIHHGSILDVCCDAVVSPANSFGFMDGGMDAVYRRYFGAEIQERVQQVIRERPHGELVVGSADVVETRWCSNCARRFGESVPGSTGGCFS